MPKPIASLLVPSIMHIQILFLFFLLNLENKATPVAGVVDPTSLEVGLGFKGLTTVNFKAFMECHDFMENFASGLCMANFALSVLCKVLGDMIYSKLDFISEIKSPFGYS